MRDDYYSKGQDIHFVMTTPEEERQLFAKARKGDEVAREFLIHNHLLFAAMQAQAMVKGRLPKNEVISAANFAVMKAMETFDPKRGFRFTTYLRGFIRGTVATLWKSKFSAGILDQSVSDAGYNAAAVFSEGFEDNSGKGRANRSGGLFDKTLSVPDESPTVEEIDFTKFNRQCLSKALAKLSKRDAELIRLRYSEWMTFDAIGKKRGVTREAVRAAHVRIIKLLKRLLEKEGAQP